MIDKLNGRKINFWKFKNKMLLAFMDLWDIVDGFEEPPPSNADPKILKDNQKCIKKVISIIGLYLSENKLAHIKNCKGPAET